jgi:uncharacterized membrane protein
MTPRALALLALLAVATASVAGVATAQTDAPGNETLATEETVIEVHLQADGAARWTVTERVVLTDEAERRAFDDLAADFEGRSSVSLGLGTFERAVGAVDAETNRSMEIRDVTYGATRENESLEDVRALNGTFTLSFTWTNFARADGERYVVDDAFRTDTGTWFGGLTADQRLVIALPEGHGASSAPKGFQQNELRWEGPTSFEPGYLRIVYSGSLEPPNPGNGESTLVWGVLGVAALALGAAGLLLVRRRGVALPPRAPDAEGTAAEGDDAAADDADEETDAELLSDEERVERLLTDNDGRMKQANIVKETGWSNAKVSQLLSAMEDEGRIRKLRIGRENLITFPDEDVGEFET